MRFWDNAILDAWEIPFGFWMDEMVSWVVANLETALDVIKWPFSFLFRNFVVSPEYHPWWELTDMPWILVCAIVLVVATLTRNLRVGVGLAVMLALCGLLGNEFWEETVLTIGLVVVSVVICAIIGIPLGVLCGRVDGVWNAVRPALDAMQVVHAFVYIIPFIFFFGLGPEPATMVTMVFAIPPLIRLTNLGIRQVPRRCGGGQPRLRRLGVEGAVGRADSPGSPRHNDRAQPDPAAVHLDDRHRRHHGRQRTRPSWCSGRSST